VKVWRKAGFPKDREWQKVRVLSSTGEPSNREDFLWLMSRTGYKAPVIEYMGGTEIGGGYLTGSMVQPASPATFTTPAMGIDILVLDENNRQVDKNQMGEVYLIPPSIGLSQTLLNKNHEDIYYAGCPAGPNNEVLRCHGDQVLRMANGFYKALGRSDDTMNLGGIKVSSQELESVMNEHPAVFETAAISFQPGGEGLEKLVVFVILKKDQDYKSLRLELGRLIAKKINPLFKIYDLIVESRLPRTVSNKIMRRELRVLYTKEHNKK
jgi:acetyl-CoA synthetase